MVANALRPEIKHLVLQLRLN